MSKKHCLNSLTLVLGTAFTSLAAVPLAHASENPFGMTTLSSGYMVATEEGAQKSTDEELKATCEKKMKEGFCGEGMCGKVEGKCGAKLKAKCESIMKKGGT
jgi:uncharacterized low-complexity protein